MKKFAFLSLLFCLTFFASQAQTEPHIHREVSTLFKKLYNASLYDSLYNCYSSSLKASSNKEQVQSFYSSLKNTQGELKTLQFKEMKSNYAVYQAVFEKGSLNMMLSIDNNKQINGLFFKPKEGEGMVSTEGPKQNSSPMRLPFDGTWKVIETGTSTASKSIAAQANSYRFGIEDKEGKAYKTEGKTNEDYYAYGKQVLSPCSGEVIMVVDGIADHQPGESQGLFTPGNCLLIKTSSNEYVFIANLQQNSIKAKKGQRLKQGQAIALCGNSSAAANPGLHLHMQEGPHLENAKPIACHFQNLVVDGKACQTALPKKGNLVVPIPK